MDFLNGDNVVTRVDKAFSYDTSDWQYLSFKAVADEAFTSIRVGFHYARNLNDAYLDGVSLYKDGYGSIFEYDTKNNLTKIVTKDGKAYQYEYDTNNNLKKSIDEYGTVTEYTYDSKHNVKTVTSLNQVTAYTYDSLGKVLSTKTYEQGDESEYYLSSSKYDANNTKRVDTDARNNTVTYYYNKNNGRLQSVEDSKYSLFYTYEKLGKLTDVCATNTDSGVSYEYSDDNLSKISLYDEWGTRFSYSFNYNAFGQLTSSYVGLRMLSSNTYDNETKLLSETTYGNGYKEKYIYDDEDRVTEIEAKDGSLLAKFSYNEDGSLNNERDFMSRRETFYDYDDQDRVIRELSSPWNLASDQTSSSVIYSYDNRDRVSVAKREIGDYSWEEEYTYNDTTLLPTKFTTTDGVNQNISYDDLGRVRSKTLGNNTSISMSYTYTDGAEAGSTTGLVKSFTAYNHATSTYTYDETGLITKIENPLYGTQEYKYNQFSQLQEEYDQYADTTTQYQYDDGGNISYKYIYHGEVSNPDSVELKYYTYDTTYSDTEDGVWDDLLIAYDGETILYDEIGNPTKYLEYEALSWNGRNLLSVRDGYGVVATYAYDKDGTRIKKMVGEVDEEIATEYIYSGGKLSAMKVGDDMLYFTYDANGEVVSVRYNGINYYYIKNPQGDVISLCRESGATECLYSYDAWGKPIMEPTSGIGALNPFRYRGYIYDAETGFYYLQSRYYDPETGRFINADTTDVLTTTPLSITDKNLFSYCDNNPVMRKDDGGAFWETVFDVISLGASVVEVVANPSDPWAWAGLVGDAVDLIPFVTGVGEITRAVKTVNKVADTVEIAKAVDFTEEAAALVKTLDRSSGFTKSTASAGRKIHQGYKVGNRFNPKFKESRKIRGVRPDYIDFDNKIIYELKPMNPRSVRSGIRQLQRYNKAYGGGFTLRLELY